MGFLTSSAKEEDRGSSRREDEELYEKLFAKIGRDFISKRDFVNIMERVLALIDPLGVNPVDLSQDAEARALAQEYKAMLDSGKNGARRYKDLVDMNSDEDE